MTDSILDGLEANANGGGEFAVLPPNGRQCKKILDDGFSRCENLLPDGAQPARKYCDEHFVGNGGTKRKPTEKPPKLVLDIGGGKPAKSSKDQRAKDTAAGATAFMNVVATGLSVSGDQVCAGAVAGGAAQWGEAVGELSKYQPWLAQFFAPVGGENQLGAWLGFLMATGAITLPILAHHNLLPASVGAKLGGVMVSADDAANAPAA